MMWGAILVVLHTPPLKVVYGGQSSVAGTLNWGRNFEGRQEIRTCQNNSRSEAYTTIVATIVATIVV
jgi:hypothetical protein